MENNILYTHKNFEDWTELYRLLKEQPLSEEFIRSKVPIMGVSTWMCVSEHQKLSESFIREFQDSVFWNAISSYQTLSEDFIREFQDMVDWTKICKFQTLSESFMEEFEEKIVWELVTRCQTLSEEFILKYRKNLDIQEVLKYQKLSYEFIKKYNLPIGTISFNPHIPIELLRHHSEKVNWYAVSKYREFTLEETLEFKGKIHLDVLMFDNQPDFRTVVHYLDFFGTDEYKNINLSRLDGNEQNEIKKIFKLKNLFKR